MPLEQRIKEALAEMDFDRATTDAIRGYGPEIFRYAHALCRDPDDASDVFAEFEVRLWQALPKIRGEMTVRALAYRIVRHAAADLYSEAYRRRRATLPSSIASRLAQSLRSSSKEILERDAARLARIRALLTPSEETLLFLRVDRKLSWDEVAAVLAAEGRAPNTAAIRKRFERLKDKISRKVEKSGLLEP